MAWDDYMVSMDGRIIRPDPRPRAVIEAEREARCAAENARWRDAMVAAGHDPVLDAKGRVDMNAYCSPASEDDIEHAGPMCKTCGWCCCEFCEEHRTDNIPTCTGVDHG